MKKRYIAIDAGLNLAVTISHDLSECPNVINVNKYRHDTTRLDKFINKVTRLYTQGYSYSKFFFFLKGIAIKRCGLSDIKFEDDTQYYIMFLDTILNTFSGSYIRDLCRKKNVRPVLFIMNTISLLPTAQRDKIKYFGDYVFAFDYKDCEKYGYPFIDEIYSKIFDNSSVKVDKDLYYIGFAKDRLETILNIFECVHDSGGTCDFNVAGVEESRRQYSNIIKYRRGIPYKESLKDMFKCNCILELQQSGQSGPTLRYYEAVCYNKKLLTNNKNVVNLPFYNPEYMKVFETVDDIDINWIRNEGGVSQLRI